MLELILKALQKPSKFILKNLFISQLCFMSIGGWSYSHAGWYTASTIPINFNIGISAATALDNGIVYALAGDGNGSVSGSDSFYKYVADDNEWVQLSSLPEERAGATIASVNGSIYVFGGFSGYGVSGSSVGTIFKYTVADDSWETLSASISSRYILSSAVVEGKVYLIGGYSGWSNPSDYVQVFDPISETVESRSSVIDGGGSSMASAVYEGKIYLIGGDNANNHLPSLPRKTRVDVYDPLSDVWSSVGTLPSDIRFGSAVTMDDSIYVTDGNKLMYYQPSTDEWTDSEELPDYVGGPASVAVGSRMYVLGTNNSHSKTEPVQIYMPYAPDVIPTSEYESHYIESEYPLNIELSAGIDIKLNKNIESIVWSLPDGTFVSGDTINYNIVNAKDYIFSVTVTDSDADITVEEFTVTAGLPNSLNVWDSNESIPEGRGYHNSIVYNEHMYLVGGYEGGGQAYDIRIANVDTSGTLSNWRTQSDSSDSAGRIDWCSRTGDAKAVAYSGYLHVFTGTTRSSDCAAIHSAKINDGGSLGEWFTHPPDPNNDMSTALAASGSEYKALTYNGYVYLVGAENNYRIRAAKLGSDGSISPFFDASSESVSLNNYPAAIYNGYMYLYGQYNPDMDAGGSGIGISVAKINDDGAVGSFTYLHDHYVGQYEAAVAINGKLFMSGGRQNGELPVSDVYSAIINTDGTLAPITVDRKLPAARANHHMTAYGDYLYVTGGSAGDEMSGYEATVWSSKIGATQQDKPTIDDQSFLVTSNEDITIHFTGNEIGRPLVYQVTHLPSRGDLSVLSNGEYRYEHTQSGNGTDTFTVSLSDGIYEDEATVSITINNNAPVISGEASTKIEIGNSFEFVPTASDSDPDDTLIYSINKVPSWATFDTTNGRLSGIPTSNDEWTTSDQIVITVSDSTRSAQLEPFDLSVIKEVTDTTYITQNVQSSSPIALNWNTSAFALLKGGNILGYSLEGWTDGSGTEIAPDRSGQAVQVSRGGYHTVVLLSDGSVETSGNNSDCQLGRGSSSSTSRVTVVDQSDATLTDVTAVAAGNRHTLALKKDGTVWSWGDNPQGQLGNGSSSGQQCYAARVTGLENVVQIAAGELISLALKRDGTVWIWGRQGGDSPTRQLSGTNNIIQIAVGGTHSIALSADGMVYTWGRTGGDYPYPTDKVLPSLEEIVEISSGQYHGLALKNDGTVWAWGQNRDGQLGRANLSYADYPLQIPGLGNVVHVSAGGYSSAVIKSDGSIWAWGRNTQGQLRDGTNENQSSPIQVDYGEVAFDMPPITTSFTFNLSEDSLVSSFLDATDSDSAEITYGVITPPTHGSLVFDSPIPNLNNLMMKTSNSEQVIVFGKDGIAIDSISLSNVVSGNDLILEIALPNSNVSASQVAIGLVVEQLDQQYMAHVVLDDIYINESGQIQLAATQYALWALAPDGNTSTVQRDPATFVSVTDGVLSINTTKLKSIINDNLNGSGVSGESGHYQIRLIFSQAFDLHYKDGNQYFSYPQVSLDGGDLYLKGNGGIYRTNIPWAQNTISTETLEKIEGGTLLQFDLIVNGVSTGDSLHVLPQTPWSSPAVSTEQLYIRHSVDSNYEILAGSASFQYVPDQDYDGTDSFTYSVKSGNKYSNVSTVAVSVTPVNDPPMVASSIADRLVVENESFLFEVLSNTFADIDRLDSLVYAVALVDDGVIVGDGSLPSWVGFDTETATFSGTPTDNSVGSYNIRVVATDQSGADASSTFLLTVSDVNDPPVIQSIDDQITDEDIHTDKIAFNISDIETSAASLTVTGVSSNTLLIPNNNITIGGNGAERFVTISPSDNLYGETDITLTVSDGVDSSSTTFTLTVNPVDDAPRFGQVIQSSNVLPDITYQLTPQIIDPDHASFTYEIVNKPSWITFDVATGLLTGDPSPTDYGAYEDIRIRVTAGDKVIESLPFTISVGDETAPAVTSSLDAGTYNAAQFVSLNCQDSGSGCGNVYYTLDGSDPSNSPSSVQYSNTIEILAITGTTQLKYFAEDVVGNQSVVSSGIYQIDVDKPLVDFVNIQDGDKFDINTNWTNVVGTAVDGDSGLNKVEMMISNGNKYMSTSAYGTFFVPDPIWNTVDFLDASVIGFNNAWAFTFGSVNRDSFYTVSVRAEDNAGNVSELTYIVYVENAAGSIQLDTDINQSLSSQSIRQTEKMTVTGQINLLGNADLSLQGKRVKLTITPPEGESSNVEIYTTTYDELGHFVFQNIGPFNKKGSYTLTSSFESSGILIGSSASNSVLVGASAGYAIVVHGKFQPTSGEPEGFASHKKSTNRIYQKLVERGFSPENIKYLSFDTPGYSNQGGLVTDEPTQAKLQATIKNWAKKKINDVPAPLYVVMVDHGEPDSFYIGRQNNDGTITPSALNGWLNNLESNLTMTALEEDRVVILGACYSGSFVDELSKQGRTIVTSAAADERSYKGGKEPDGIRDGEFFIAELFKELGHGYSLKRSFELATRKTENKFQNRGRSANSINSYFDKAKQHPLLDDNGDGMGSNSLTATGDGQHAASIFLGVGKTFDTNSAENPAEFIESIPTQTLSASDPAHITLWSKDNVGGNAPRAWLEIMTPEADLDDSGSSSFFQIEVDLPGGAMLYNEDNERWELDTSTITDFGGFTTSGTYEVYYYIEDKETNEVSSPWSSTLYKAKTGNTPPNSFNLLTPATDTEVEKLFVLDWQETSDPEGDPLSYTLTIALDINFNDILLNRDGITSSTSWIDGTVALQDQTNYYWKVTATDLYGATRESATFHFTTNFTSSIPGIVQGIVFSNSDSSRLGGATLTLSNNQTITTEVDGSFLASLLPGNYTAVMSNGSKDIQVATIEVTANSISRYLVGVGAESVTTPATEPTNSAPVISSASTPVTTIEAGESYTFTATATDANGDALTFTEQNLPDWLSFNTTSNSVTLSGIPSEDVVGTTGSILISVTDGTDTDSLTAFSIEVTSATSQQPPVTRSPLTLHSGWNLSHFSKETEVTAIKQQVPEIDAIWSFLNCEKQWKFALFNRDSSTPAVTSDPALTTLDPGKGYWVKLQDDVEEIEVTLSGTAVNTPITLQSATLYSGWNSVGVTENVVISQTVIPEEISSIWGWEGYWVSHIKDVPTFLNSLQSFDQNKGYFVYSDQAAGSDTCAGQ
jgi:N-acetylneuraminic acid mutarotase